MGTSRLKLKIPKRIQVATRNRPMGASLFTGHPIGSFAAIRESVSALG